MLKMRLQRVGRRNHPTYRVVVVESRQGPKSGKYVDLLGSYDPHQNHVQIDTARAKEWLAKGVQASPTVHNLLIDQKVVEGKKVNALPKKTPLVSESAEAEAPAEVTAPEAESTDEAPETPAETPEAETPAEETPDAVPTEEAPAEAEPTPETSEEAEEAKTA